MFGQHHGLRVPVRDRPENGGAECARTQRSVAENAEGRGGAGHRRWLCSPQDAVLCAFAPSREPSSSLVAKLHLATYLSPKLGFILQIRRATATGRSDTWKPGKQQKVGGEYARTQRSVAENAEGRGGGRAPEKVVQPARYRTLRLRAFA